MINTLLSLGFKILLSPLIIFLIVWALTDSQREGFLVALLFYTAYSLGTLIFKLFAHANPSMFINFIFTSIKTIVFLVSLIFYWLIYLLIWGNDFGLDKTFAIFN
jgi:hypothetical protein